MDQTDKLSRYPSTHTASETSTEEKLRKDEENRLYGQLMEHFFALHNERFTKFPKPSGYQDPIIVLESAYTEACKQESSQAAYERIKGLIDTYISTVDSICGPQYRALFTKELFQDLNLHFYSEVNRPHMVFHTHIELLESLPYFTRLLKHTRRIQTPDNSTSEATEVKELLPFFLISRDSTFKETIPLYRPVEKEQVFLEALLLLCLGQDRNHYDEYMYEDALSNISEFITVSESKDSLGIFYAILKKFSQTNRHAGSLFEFLLTYVKSIKEKQTFTPDQAHNLLEFTYSIDEQSQSTPSILSIDEWELLLGKHTYSMRPFVDPEILNKSHALAKRLHIPIAFLVQSLESGIDIPEDATIDTILSSATIRKKFFAFLSGKNQDEKIGIPRLVYWCGYGLSMKNQEEHDGSYYAEQLYESAQETFFQVIKKYIGLGKISTLHQLVSKLPPEKSHRLFQKINTFFQEYEDPKGYLPISKFGFRTTLSSYDLHKKLVSTIEDLLPFKEQYPQLCDDLCAELFALYRPEKILGVFIESDVIKRLESLLYSLQQSGMTIPDSTIELLYGMKVKNFLQHRLDFEEEEDEQDFYPYITPKRVPLDRFDQNSAMAETTRIYKKDLEEEFHTQISFTQEMAIPLYSIYLKKNSNFGHTSDLLKKITGYSLEDTHFCIALFHDLLSSGNVTSITFILDNIKKNFADLGIPTSTIVDRLQLYCAIRHQSSLYSHLSTIQPFFGNSLEDQHINTMISLTKSVCNEVGGTENDLDSIFDYLYHWKIDTRITRSEISLLRKKLIETPNGDDYLIPETYNTLKTYLEGTKKSSEDTTTEDILWKYLGGKNRHDMLHMVQNFLHIVTQVEHDTGTDKREIVRILFQRAGMGTGNQAQVLVEIMNTISPTLWIELETESVYPHENPPLRDPHTLNLSKIRNEIVLRTQPEILAALRSIPDSRHDLRDYAYTLFNNPTVNAEAVHRFIENPDAFFGSRSGAGEEKPVVDTLLSELEPRRYPNWGSTESRDAIVSGSYDTLNEFPSIAMTWSENPAINTIVASTQSVLHSTLEHPENRHQLLDSALQLLSGQEQYSRENKKIYQELRKESFLFFLQDPQYVDAFFSHLREKGPRIIEKAFEYQLKKKTEFYGKNPIPVSEIEIMDQKKNLCLSIVSEHTTLTQDTLISFWEHIFATGWLEPMDLAGMSRRAASLSFDSEYALIQHAILQSSNVTETAKKVLQDMLQTYITSTNTTWYTAKVCHPSDPLTALAGTITGQCDAFGHGKKSHFLITPTTAQFVLFRSKGTIPDLEDSKQLFAQSTITLGKRVFSSAKERADFFSCIQSGKSLEESVKEATTANSLSEFLHRYANAPREITLDSIEVSSNKKDLTSQEEMLEVLSFTFTAFRSQSAVYDAQVIAGKNYSYLVNPTLPQAENTGLWMSPLAYSDNPPNLPDAVLVAQEHSSEESEAAGVRPIKPSDAFAVALIEEIAFRRSNGAQHITGLLHMTREVNSACIHAAHYDHNPTAFLDVAKTDTGYRYNGYIIAYLRGESIYITDASTTGEEKGVGTRLLMNLLQSVATDPKLNTKTITMDCRGETSAPAIMKPSNVAILESLEFVDPATGETVSYTINGPSFDSINPNSMYSIEFVPKRKKPARE